MEEVVYEKKLVLGKELKNTRMNKNNRKNGVRLYVNDSRLRGTRFIGVLAMEFLNELRGVL